MLPPGGCRARREHRCLRETRAGGDERERRRRRPRRPRWQFTWTHQRCDRWQLAYHALPQHAQPLGAAQRVLSAPHELTWPLFPCTRLSTEQRRQGTAPGVHQEAVRRRARATCTSTPVVPTTPLSVVDLLEPAAEPCGNPAKRDDQPVIKPGPAHHPPRPQLGRAHAHLEQLRPHAC